MKQSDTTRPGGKEQFHRKTLESMSHEALVDMVLKLQDQRKSLLEEIKQRDAVIAEMRDGSLLKE